MDPSTLFGMGIDGEKLKRLRILKGWTQTKLADKAGVSIALVSAIERAQTNGSPVSASKLAEALDVSIEDLWSWDD